jgi:arylsulfatase A-like enzyme
MRPFKHAARGVDALFVDSADAPTQKETQYYEMLGTRGIWHQGWTAVIEHGPVGDDRYVDLERHLAAAFARD